MERDIIYYHIAIQQIEQFNKQSIFIKLNDHYHIYKNHKSKWPYDVEETNKPKKLRHKKKLELKANMDIFFLDERSFFSFLPLLRRELMCLEQSTMRGKKHGVVWACIRRKSSSDNFYFL